MKRQAQIANAQGLKVVVSKTDITIALTSPNSQISVQAGRGSSGQLGAERVRSGFYCTCVWVLWKTPYQVVTFPGRKQHMKNGISTILNFITYFNFLSGKIGHKVI